MIKGISRFSPYLGEKYFDSADNSIEAVTLRLNAAIAYVQEWQTLMNIFSYKKWVDPLTEEIHFVLSPKGMMKAKHIGDAVEVKA